MYFTKHNYKAESIRLAEQIIKTSEVFIASYNEEGEVKIHTYDNTNIVSFVYDCLLPAIKDLIANYYIFNSFSKTTLLIKDGEFLHELEFNTLEELRTFYLFEV